MPELIVADVMNTQVLAVRPEMSVHEVATFLTENQITGAPVLDQHGHLVGVVSETDIAEYERERADLVYDHSDPEFDLRGWEDKANPDEIRGLHVEGGDDLTVRDIMTPAAYTIPHDTPVSRVAQTMIAGRIHRLLVTRQGRLAGIVTSLDLLKLLGPEPRPVARPRPLPRSVIVGS
jgi:CBS domain-containing protein